MFLFDFIRGST